MYSPDGRARIDLSARIIERFHLVLMIAWNQTGNVRFQQDQPVTQVGAPSVQERNQISGEQRCGDQCAPFGTAGRELLDCRRGKSMTRLSGGACSTRQWPQRIFQGPRIYPDSPLTEKLRCVDRWFERNFPIMQQE